MLQVSPRLEISEAAFGSPSRRADHVGRALCPVGLPRPALCGSLATDAAGRRPGSGQGCMLRGYWRRPRSAASNNCGAFTIILIAPSWASRWLW
jgi:hypothetical protein